MMDLAVHILPNGEAVFALDLEYLVPGQPTDADTVAKDMVALVAAMGGHLDGRVILQIQCNPEPKSPERGSLAVSFLGVMPSSATEAAALRAGHLADDLLDLLAAPPLRWSFRPVADAASLMLRLDVSQLSHVAEIARREEVCAPLELLREAGFRADVEHPLVDRALWSLWMYGSASPDMRRVASVLLAQDAPVVLRLVVQPTFLTDNERDEVERVVATASAKSAHDGLLRAASNTLEGILYLRPLFEVQCLVASSSPLSRGLMSTLGHSISAPAEHGGSSTVLRGGFAVLRDGIESMPGALLHDLAELRACQPAPTLAPSGLARLRRLMGAWEAANVLRLPIADEADFPGLARFDLPSLVAPVADLSESGSRLGSLVGRSDSAVMVEDEERFRHLYVLGQTGTGKSTLLFNLALQDIERGAGVAVLDPHGDLVESLLACIPEERIDDVVLVDPADPVAVVGVNLMEAETDVQRQYLVSELCAMFYALFDPRHQGIVGPRYESMLRGAAGLLLARPDQPSSLLDVPTVFADAKVRQFLLDGVFDPVLTEFWIGEVAQNRSNDFGEVLGWFRSKFEVFRTSPQVRNVIGQARSTISFSDVLGSQRILLVNLSKGLLGEYNAALLGQVVFMRLWAASLERASIPKEDRGDFFVYIDEFQNMTTESLPAVLSEARKFRVGLTLANQFFTQVAEGTRDAIMGNVGSRVTFRVGPRDASPFAFWLGNGVVADDLTRLPNYHGVAALSHRGVPLDAFVMRGDPPRTPAGGGRAEAVRQRSRDNWARPISELDDEFFGRWAHVPGSFAAQAARAKNDRMAAAARPGKGETSFLDSWLAKKDADRSTADSAPSIDDPGEDQ